MGSSGQGPGRRRRSVRRRLLLLLAALVCSFGLALALLTALQRHQGKELIASRQDELEQLFRRLLQLLDGPLRNFAYDYTYWDEMVHFVATGDPAWGDENLRIPMPTFGAHSVWVYRPDSSLVYHANADAASPAWEPEAFNVGVARLFGERRLIRFFAPGPGGIWEVSGATIHPGSDVQRQTPPKGYFLVGSCLKDGMLNELSVLLGGRAIAVPKPSPEPSPSWRLPDKLRLSRRLRGWDGSIVGYMEADVPLSAVTQQRAAATRQLALAGVSAVALLVLVAWALRAWVTRPLQVLATSLDTGDLAGLVALEQRDDELSHLAGLIGRFHSQHAALDSEVRQRQRAERELLRSLDFERLMATISTRFVSHTPETLDREIRAALQRLGTFADVDRCQVFQFRPDGVSYDCTHEWCREDVPPSQPRRQGVTTDACPWALAALKRGDVLTVDGADALPPEASALRAEMAADGTRAMLRVPMLYGGTTVGFVGLEALQAERHWPAKTVRQLRFAGEILVNALEHQRAEARRRQLEDDLGHARRIDSLGRLAGSVAHDLNNLLVPVMGYADILCDELPEDHRSRGDAECIRRAAVQARGLTRQLLAFARRQVLDLQVMELGTEVKLFSQILRRLIPEDIQIRSDVAPDTGLVRADPVQIRQIIVNLALNARDAMPQGGQITITTANHWVADHGADLPPGVKPGVYVMLGVSDTGVGMTQEAQEHLFEPFFTTKAPGKGTGLGLAVVHGIVSQHGGRITIASSPGRGTTVSVYLPRVAPEKAPDNGAGPATQASTVTATVLVVEDADSVRDFVSRALPSHGFRVVSAAAAEAALELARGFPDTIDILLTDVVMPGRSGPELYRDLHEARPSLKVLFMSGYPADAIARHGGIGGDYPLIAKPFAIHELVAALQRLLS